LEGWRFAGADDCKKMTDILSWSKGFLLHNSTSTQGNYFEGCVNMFISATNTPNLNNITSLKAAFKDCGAVGFAPRIIDWNTTNVTDMSEMFKSSIAPGQLIWNTINVTNMREMFSHAAFVSGIDYILDFDTKNVVDMYRMFYNSTNFVANINKWNTENVTNMSDMFYNCIEFNQPLNSWNVSNVNNMSDMFYNCQKFNQQLNSWNTSNVTNMGNMFYNCNEFNQTLDSWYVFNVSKMSFMFFNCQKFNQPLNSWNTSNVTNMSYMFYNCIEFNQPLNSWNTSNVTNMSYMFHDCVKFNQPLNAWNVEKVTTMQRMFKNAISFKQDISDWNPLLCNSFFEFFNGANMNNNLPLSSIQDTTNYDNLLVKWANNIPPLQDVVPPFHGGTAKYSLRGQEGRNILIVTKNWILIDGGPIQQRIVAVGDTGSSSIPNLAYSDISNNNSANYWNNPSTAAILQGKKYGIVRNNNSNLWIATGDGPPCVIYSSNGINWQGGLNNPFGFTGRGYNIAYNPESFVDAYVAVGTTATTNNKQSVYYSVSNGLIWAAALNSPFDVGYGVCYGGGRYVAVGKKSTFNLSFTTAYSTVLQGNVWTYSNNNPFTVSGRSVAYNPTTQRWVAVGEGTQSAVYSDNMGVSWNDCSNNPFDLSGGRSIACNGTRFVACGINLANPANTMSYSNDGRTWNAAATPPLPLSFNNNVNVVSWNNILKVWFAGTNSNTNNILISFDGINWVIAGTAPMFNAVFGIA
jgi:surface protein